MRTVSARVLIGLIVVGVLLLGGLAASFVNIRNVKGPRERAFVIRAYMGMWTLVFTFLFLMYVLALPYRYLLLAVYLILFPVLIYRWSNMYQLIRQIEEREIGAENSKHMREGPS